MSPASPLAVLVRKNPPMVTHACPRCGMKHRGAFDRCTRCRNETSTGGYVVTGRPAMAQLFAVVRSARALAATAPRRAAHRELVAALAAMDRAWRRGQ
jgi:hypothetical protein